MNGNGAKLVQVGSIHSRANFLRKKLLGRNRGSAPKEYDAELHKSGSILFDTDPRESDFKIDLRRGQMCVKFLKRAKFVEKKNLLLLTMQN